jgi:hypothetical protein
MAHALPRTFTNLAVTSLLQLRLLLGLQPVYFAHEILKDLAAFRTNPLLQFVRDLLRRSWPLEFAGLAKLNAHDLSECHGAGKIGLGTVLARSGQAG